MEGSFLACCLAMFMLGSGVYGLEEIDGDRKMPVFICREGDLMSWFVNEFGLDLGEALSKDKDVTRRALRTVRLAGERTSMNDFALHAHDWRD